MGVECATPRTIFSNERECAARENLRNAADTGESGGERCRQNNGPWSWDVDSVGSPEIRVYNPEIGVGNLMPSTG